MAIFFLKIPKKAFVGFTIVFFFLASVRNFAKRKNTGTHHVSWEKKP
jgi:hypothetical protein